MTILCKWVTAVTDASGMLLMKDLFALFSGEDIAQLAQEVDAYVNNEASLDLLKVTVGQLCLAQFSSDGLWYRARVIEIAQNSVKVWIQIYIDPCGVVCCFMHMLSGKLLHALLHL